ncbi:MAG: class I SAM-dependent methyltransferase [Candidatus Cloacimonetes bacterium]|nr:class I SAM-dependent methyltransferase [Candidatus Cloacimonadota bacterium]
MIHFEEARLPGYELLDSGAGFRLERFGARVLERPDPNALWSRRLKPGRWQAAHCRFDPTQRFGSSHWDRRGQTPEWEIQFNDLRLRLRLTPFKHTGLFPEQEPNWRFLDACLRARIARDGSPPEVLNLFGYTGVASLVAAAAGARVCHVDASPDAVEWARHNQMLSGLEQAPIRWITDDCIRFLEREQRRGRRYDAVILDPPAFGRDKAGKVFRFEEDVPLLLQRVRAVLSDNPLALVFNAYSMGYSATVIRNLVEEILPADALSCHELQLRETGGPAGRVLPCGVCVRYRGRDAL